jgi:hypothetical protein
MYDNFEKNKNILLKIHSYLHRSGVQPFITNPTILIKFYDIILKKIIS